MTLPSVVTPQTGLASTPEVLNDSHWLEQTKTAPTSGDPLIISAKVVHVWISVDLFVYINAFTFVASLTFNVSKI